MSGPKRTSAPFSAAFVPPGSIHHVHVATTTGTIHLVCMRRMQEMRYRHSLPREDTRPASSPPLGLVILLQYYCRHRGHTTAIVHVHPPYSTQQAQKASSQGLPHGTPSPPPPRLLDCYPTSTSVTHRQKTTNHGLIWLRSAIAGLPFLQAEWS